MYILTWEGGGDIFNSDNIVEKVTSASDDTKTKFDEENFKGMCLLMRSDSVCYSGLLKFLKESKYLGCDEYSSNLTST